MKIRLQRVHYMPNQLKPSVLYVSEEFGTAAHLCACGCGTKIRTPLGPTEWSLKVSEEGPTLYPSIGNWQQSCKSHYWIKRGEIIWSEQWTQEEINVGRRYEQARRRSYYAPTEQQDNRDQLSLWSWLKNIFKSK